MQLFINPKGGFAGDMFAAALISAGADEQKITKCMLAAAEKIGRASIFHLRTADGSSRLKIDVEHHHGHLSSHKARHLLEDLFREFEIKDQYQEFGFNMLNALVKAEKTAHETHDFDMEGHHFHHHHHTGSHSHEHEEPEAWLHEAQDILIDIMGAVAGLQDLKAPTTAHLINPISYGGGSISFSHGTLKAPAPATKVMIENNDIPVTAGPIETELFTPTGASVITALKAFETKPLPKTEPLKHGTSRGTKDLPIPPLEIMLF